MRLFTMAVITLATSLGVFAQSTTSHPTPALRQLNIPYYRPGSPHPTAVFRVASLQGDYDRRGFFKIGLLPILAADQVEIEIREARDLPLVLQHLEPRIRGRNGTLPLVFHDVRFRLQHSTTPFLEARDMRLLQGQTSFQLKQVVYHPTAGPVRLPKAFLDFSKRDALHLTWMGTNTLNLVTELSTTSTASPTP